MILKYQAENVLFIHVLLVEIEGNAQESSANSSIVAEAVLFKEYKYWISLDWLASCVSKYPSHIRR